MKRSLQSFGGLGKSAMLRKEYNNNPIICLYCNSPILCLPEHKLLTRIKQKKFCNKSCAAKLNNHKFPKREAKPKDQKAKRIYKPKERTLVKVPRVSILATRTKGGCNKRNIHQHSKLVVRNRPKICVHCGYSKHIEICHIKAVKDFPATATIGEMNNPDNLLLLCPNCHWEFDNIK